MITYIHLDKKTNDIQAFGSIRKLSEVTNINEDSLYYVFSKQALKELETDNFRIVKREILKSSRNG